MAKVTALADAMPAGGLRLLILLAAWCQLRRGELLGLERRDFDLLHGKVTIERSVNYVAGGRGWVLQRLRPAYVHSRRRHTF